MNQRIKSLFENSLVIDGLMSYYFLEDPECQEGDCSHYPVEDFATLKPLTGIDCGSITVSTTAELLDERRQYISGSPNARVIERGSDIERAREEGRFGILFYSQKHYPLKGSVAPLAGYYARGLRVYQLAYNARIDPGNTTPEEMLAGGSDQPEQGLTELGRAVVAELNRLNMIVDVSHLSRPSVLETVACSRAPVMANHANAQALTGSPRNKSDEELRAIAGTGGVIGITTVKWMLDRDGDGMAGIDDFVAHLDYVVDVVGVDHVGVASDASLNGWWKSSRHYADEELAAPDRWKRVAARLLGIKRPDGGSKYSDEDLKKIFGLNFLRVYRQVLI